ncbi:MAG: DNA protecting protein DprA [Candidatus Staskawiczbacteria bacterium RIFCSPHIGHO2_02_FULL_34_9]|uniref:DNA protecting protein DprA n=1 Tax=Candidatus Staskawiczbacteria bacterium RIFCSPHIGHO2_02_FULL_34_9 TaxID=1802206 RepID=A0A1G2HX53_9BACT|nr:MAG: DNA protecting protein DprA [Candidatus Staskawiczbacteria bacterium RIFCSPHIGHO2_02_FULL_34_9]
MEIQEITIDDKQYPESLKNIKNPPKVLYYRGSFIKEEEKLFAIVGTRIPSDYGKEVTLKISSELAESGVTIISGMAPGIDTIAHKAVVEKGMRTIAVLGTGLDEESIYPKDNIGLSREIIENGGCLISELPAGTRGSKFTFPKRNRIVSGLSSGVLVVEAKEKSGSLITAKYAKEQEKNLFAIPGSIFSSNSKGTNSLIKEGAKIVTSTNDILETLDISDVELKGNLLIEDADEKLIINQLKEESLDINKIIEKTGLSPSAVATKLALMEISGTIRNLGGNTYALNR